VTTNTRAGQWTVQVPGGDPASAATARRVLGHAMQRDGIPDAVRADAALVVSELVTNAVKHTDTPQVVCGIQQTERHLIVEVRDNGPRVAVTRSAMPGRSAEQGRGLAIIRALAPAVGSRPTADGCVRWAALPMGR
jgi:anti-sigma regulatory factor (Ser/Thr protein kinase)